LRKFFKVLFQVVGIFIITLIMIEVLFQVIYLNLPQAIIQRMPQYPERYGIVFDTTHRAREYPANEVVNFEVNQYSGDLYQVSCLSPLDAIAIEPYQVSYTRNEHGFRTPLLENTDADIVFIGDSFTAAESIVTPYWENLELNTVALGLPGSGTVEQKILLEEFGLQYNPNTIVLSYFAGNDLTDNQAFHDLQQQGLTFADVTHQNRNPLEYTVTFHLGLFMRDALTTPSTSNCHYPVSVKTTPVTLLTFFDRMVTLLAVDREGLQNSEAFNITTTTINDLITLASDNDAEFILMYIPQKAEIYWDLLTEDDKQLIVTSLTGNALIDTEEITVDAIDNAINVQRDLLKQLSIEQNFQFLDLTPVLQTSAQKGESPYFFSDTHWNQLGHDLVRDTLIEYLP